MPFDFRFIERIFPQLLEGIWTTVELVVLSSLLGIVIGLAACLGKMKAVGPVNWVCRGYIVVARGIPEMVLMFWIYYCAPLIFDVRASGFYSAVLGMALYCGAMLAEVFRAGISAVPSGQFLASKALGLSGFWTWWEIIAPQALRFMIPALLATLALQVKLSGIASAVGVGELVYTANIIGGQSYRYFELYTTIGVIYFVIIAFFSLAARRYERHLSQRA